MATEEVVPWDELTPMEMIAQEEAIRPPAGNGSPKGRS